MVFTVFCTHPTPTEAWKAHPKTISRNFLGKRTTRLEIVFLVFLCDRRGTLQFCRENHPTRFHPTRFLSKLLISQQITDFSVNFRFLSKFRISRQIPYFSPESRFLGKLYISMQVSNFAVAIAQKDRMWENLVITYSAVAVVKCNNYELRNYLGSSFF